MSEGDPAPLRLQPGGPLRGELRVPGDKSISHRALMLGAVLPGQSRIEGLLDSADVRSTRACLEAMGARITPASDGSVRVQGGPLRAPEGELDCGNSGTTMRLLAGLVAGAGLPARLTGDASLRRRPMRRIMGPLAELGLAVRSAEGGLAPLELPAQRSTLRAGRLSLELASAQVKSAVLLAGLMAELEIELVAPGSRDHTERMLAARGTGLSRAAGPEGRERICLPADALRRGRSVDVRVPGDISSAAFLLVAASLVPGSEVLLRGVGLNPTRTGILDALRRMGADIEVRDAVEVGGEPLGDLLVRAAPLRGVEVGGSEIPRLIDELPVLALAAACAEGETLFRDAAELRVKESDRLASTAALLRALGVEVAERPDGLRITGRPGRLQGARLPPTDDHRLAMVGAVAGLVAEGGTVVPDGRCVAVSYPGFGEGLVSLQGRG